MMARSLMLSAAICAALITSGFAEEPPARFVQGRVVYLADGLKRLHGVETPADVAENTLALETFDGELLPLVEDIRGRAFRRDERLRKIDVELLVREIPKTPLLQVIGVRQLDRAAGKKFELDYWCDICAIAMYELKQCDCCQGPIELRLRELPSDHDSR